MTRCLNCGKKIPSWYMPQLCDFCLGYNMVEFFESDMPLNEISDEDFISPNEVYTSDSVKPKNEIIDKLKKDSTDQDNTLERVKEWVNNPVSWVMLQSILCDNSMFLVNGSVYLDMHPLSKVGVGHILNKLKESKHWPKIKWHSLKDN